MAKQPKLGTGKRFSNLEHSLEARNHTKAGKVYDPGALAASIGREKYGAKKFAKLSAGGKKIV